MKIVTKTYKWHVVQEWKNKPQGQVWRVQEAGGKTGYFKFAYKDQWYDAGPIIGNEWITWQLAQKLAIFSADLDVTSILHNETELRGVVSMQKNHDTIVSWRNLDTTVVQDPYSQIADADTLFGVIAFDAWITNIDRGSGKNILFYRDAPQERYRWYLIDHGYALYGCDRKWAVHSPLDDYWHHIWQFYHIPRGWQTFATKDVLLKAADNIRALRQRDIEDIVHSVPDPSYTETLQRDVIAMLLYRQKALSRMLTEWIHYKGVKECLV